MKEITIKDVFNKEKAQAIETTLDEIIRLRNENKILREELEYEKRKNIIK